MTSTPTHSLHLQEEELSALDGWANEVRDGIVEQVHMALDSYERASQQHVASLLLQEASLRNDAIDQAYAQCRSDLLSALESLGKNTRSGLGSAARDDLHERHDARLTDLELMPGPLGERLAALETAAGKQGTWREWNPLGSLPQPPRLADAADAEEGAVAALAKRLRRGLAALEDEVLSLQGEHALLEARAQAQSVSGAVFALRAWDMDEQGRARSLEALAEREAEAKRLVEAAREAEAWGGMREVLAALGVQRAKGPSWPPEQSFGDVLEEAVQSELQV